MTVPARQALPHAEEIQRRLAHAEEIHRLTKELLEYAEAYRQVVDERDSARRERDHAHQTIDDLRKQLAGGES